MEPQNISGIGKKAKIAIFGATHSIVPPIIITDTNNWIISLAP